MAVKVGPKAAILPSGTSPAPVGGVTAVVQLGFTGYTLVTGVLGGTSALLLIPQVIAMLSSLVLAVKTAATALRGGAR